MLLSWSRNTFTAQSVSGCLASRVSRSIYSETDGTVLCACGCGSGPRGRVWCDDSALTLLINHRAWKSLAARHAFLRWSTAWGREMPSDQFLRNKTTIFSHILTLMTFKPVIYSEKHIVDHNSSSYLSYISSLLKSCDALGEKHTFKLLFTKNRPVHHSSDLIPAWTRLLWHWDPSLLF